MPDIRFKIFERLPALFQFTLPHQGKNGDRRILPMLPAATGDDLPRRQLFRPLRKQTLIGFLVISKVTGGLKKKIAVNDPEIAIHRWPDFEHQPAVFHLTGLLNVSRAGNQKLAVLSGITAGDAPEGLPLFPEVTSFSDQAIRLLHHLPEKIDGLIFLRETDEVAQRLIRRSFTVGQIQRIPKLPPRTGRSRRS